jgi:uncharacterized SAM-dependent methyltransferase
MSGADCTVSLLDLEPATSDFLEQAIAGLSSSPRTLPSKFFYDERGSNLFQEICELPEYYVTRTETEILRQYGAEMADSIGENAELVGFGTGAGVKTRMLLDHLRNLIAYVPVDISKQRLTESAEALSREIPALEILPVCADYLPTLRAADAIAQTGPHRRLFPGIHHRQHAAGSGASFPHRVARLCGHSGGLIIGVDLQKSRNILGSRLQRQRGGDRALQSQHAGAGES